MSDDEWHLVQKVHVRGAFKVTRAAWPFMIKQNYGRIINTASAAGLYGNYGQANYSTAKLALHGLTLSLKTEGAKKNILVNTIAPLAASKMTETVMPKEILDKLNPEFIIPLVALLIHESSTENGSVFEAGAGWIGKLRRERSKGAVFKADPTFTPTAVSAKWSEITDFKQPQYPTTIMETDWMGLLEQAKSLSSNPRGDKELRFDGRVAVVTGAGAGLGRAYAHMFSKLGASVVVNDLKAKDGSSGADKVVEEIKFIGGKAVANYNSVEDGDKIIETCIKAFGRVDIVVNNAGKNRDLSLKGKSYTCYLTGVLRDKSFIKMTDEDWDFVYKVHLTGSYKVSKAAWPYMLEQKYGRIINTASAVGLYGNFGQANYSTVKSGLIAFSNTLAQEGKKFNIIVNTIAPNAGTNMTATVMPDEMVEALKPEYVAPLIGYLAHESNKESGSVFECGSGWISKVRWQRTRGVGFPNNEKLLPETVAQKWKEIGNFDDGKATYPLTTQDSFTALQANFENVIKSNVNNGNNANNASTSDVSKVDIEKSRKADFPEHSFSFTERDVILYALGVGAKRTDLDLVYENNDKFKALPTFGVVPAFDCFSKNVPFGDYLPNFNPMMLVHGEQYLELYKPIPTHGKLVSKGRIIDFVDKGKSSIAIIGVTTKDDKGALVCENEFSFFIKGVGGFGSGGTSVQRPSAATNNNNPPSRAPDAIVKEKVNPDQAALFRLSGDYNPLHIDPEMSKMGGFEVPILHGLCTFGIASKHIMKQFAYNDFTRFKSIKVRFAKHVFPGETIETHMWKEDNKIIFQVKVVERDSIVISNAALEFNSTEPIKKSLPIPLKTGIAVDGFQASQIFTTLETSLNSQTPEQRKSQVSKVKAIFAFDISNGEKTASWFADFKNGTGLVSQGKPPGNKTDMTVSVSDSDFMLLASGKLQPQKAFMQGKIKVKGNVGLATKLDAVLKPQSAKI